MNTKEDQLCMDVLAAIAWADGEVSVAEAGTLIDRIDRMEYVDHHRVQEAISKDNAMAANATPRKMAHARLVGGAPIDATAYCGAASSDQASNPAMASENIPMANGSPIRAFS
jgi:hypothetical protein